MSEEKDDVLDDVWVTIQVRPRELSALMNHSQLGVALMMLDKPAIKELQGVCYADMAELGIDRWNNLIRRIALELPAIEGLEIKVFRNESPE